MNKEQVEMVKGLTLANEFLKILRSFKKENDREDSIPHEVIESLANAQLQTVMEKHELDPEHLVWGLVQVIEIFLKMTETDPEDLAGAIDQFLKLANERG